MAQRPDLQRFRQLAAAMVGDDATACEILALVGYVEALERRVENLAVQLQGHRVALDAAIREAPLLARRVGPVRFAPGGVAVPVAAGTDVRRARASGRQLEAVPPERRQLA